jgi:TonB family protein
MLSAVLVLLTAAVLMQSEAAKPQPECAGPNRAPVVVQKADPEYSQDARKSRIEGTVVMTVEVGTDGEAHHIRVARGLGHGLDEEAITAVARWRFKPAVKDGVCVQVPATIEMVFRLPLEPESARGRVP